MITVLAFGAQIDETVLKRSKIGHAGILWQLENTPRISLYKEIWAGCHHKLEFGIPWGDAGQGLKDMNEDRLNKKVFNWGIDHGENRCRNWYFKFKTHLSSLGLHVHYFSITFLTE